MRQPHAAGRAVLHLPGLRPLTRRVQPVKEKPGSDPRLLIACPDIRPYLADMEFIKPRPATSHKPQAGQTVLVAALDPDTGKPWLYRADVLKANDQLVRILLDGRVRLLPVEVHTWFRSMSFMEPRCSYVLPVEFVWQVEDGR